MDRIGHYTIVAELGRGGMGVVYKAHEESLNRFVAIKVLGEHLEAEPEYVERFVREARSAAALSHPNIVQIYAIAEDAGHHYFVMEYVQGTNVQRMIHTKGKLPPVDAARLILQAAAGLQDAHAQGVVHRDIKPANLMVTERGLVKIADFGLALMGGVTTRLTATGMLMGTPGYLSPEQCLDQPVDHRTDIYSLGVTFFEMVTGTMPFRADSPLALLKLIVEVEPPEVRELNPDVDDDLRAIIAGMLAKDRERRTSSCSEVISGLQGWLDARGERVQSGARAVAAGTAAGLVPPPPPPTGDADINTQPTVAVESGASRPSTPPPLPAADAGTAPAAVATTPSTQQGPAHRRTNTALIVAAALFVVAVAAVGAVLTVKSGILDAVLHRGSKPIAGLEGGADPATTPDPGEPAAVASTDPAAATEITAATRADAGPSSDTEADTPAPSSSDRPPPKIAHASPDHGAEVPPARSADAGSGTAARLRESAPLATQPTAPEITLPQPTATVVLAVGERLLAVEAEQYVKARLEAAGVEILDVTSIPGLEGLVNTEARPAPEQIREALRPYARYLVPVRVDFLGERAITYMGQRDTAYQARVNMAVMDLATGRTVGKPTIVTVEYTQLNAARVVSDKLRPPTTTLVQVLPRD